MGRVREHNEDCLYVDRWIAQASGSHMARHYSIGANSLTLAVIDGMGGYAGGSLASVTVALSLAAGESADLADRVSATNRAVVERGKQTIGHNEMGATVAGVVFAGGVATVFNVGDSRVYRYVSGFLGQLSVDDLVPDPTGVRKGLVSQSLGGPIERAIDPHELSVPLEDGQVFLLCSDGLHDCVENAGIAPLLELQPPEAAAALVQAALDAGAPDNVSVIVARVSGASE